MSIDLSSPDAVATLPETDRFVTGPLLVATDGSTSSEAAFPAAMLLAEHLQADVEVLSVIEPIPLMGGYPSAPTTYLGDVVDTEPALQRATEQVKKLGEGAAQWSVNVIQGNPVDVIVREARERQARLMVVGLNHHDTLDRLLWGDTMLGLVRRGDAPVLAVSPALKSLPRRVVVAVDFSQASVSAMRTALMLVDAPATVYLVHVKASAELPLTELALWDREYDIALPEAFDRVIAGLHIPLGVRIERVTLLGHTPKAILEFAESVDADLLVAGSHGRGALGRLVVGSVATHLLRGTPCSILIVPRAAAKHLGPEPHRLHVEGFMPTEMADWSLRLNEFTRRNAARRVVLEVDDPEFGAQAEVTDYPFLGADFDHQSRRVEIMLGDPETEGRHLTHSTVGVTSLDILTDPENRDTVLRLAHGNGQTLLRFV